MTEAGNVVFLFLFPVFSHAISLCKKMIKVSLLGKGRTAFRTGFGLSRNNCAFVLTLFHQILLTTSSQRRSVGGGRYLNLRLPFRHLVLVGLPSYAPKKCTRPKPGPAFFALRDVGPIFSPENKHASYRKKVKSLASF